MLAVSPPEDSAKTATIQIAFVATMADFFPHDRAAADASIISATFSY